MCLLILSLLEFYKLTGNKGVHVQKYFAVFASVVLFIALWLFIRVFSTLDGYL
jgi:hypothetical protein